MPKELQITKLSFVILARSHNPSLLNPDFLKVNNIVDQDWGTISPTFSTEQLSQVIFKSGVSFLLQPDRLIIEQIINDIFKAEDIYLADVISRYLKTLPHVNYQALGINPTAFIGFTSEEEVDDYIFNQLLRPGDWKNHPGGSLEASINFTYSFEEYHIRINVSKAIKTDEENPEKKVFGLVYSGNIHRDISLDIASEDRVKPLIEQVRLWENDLNSYLSIINDCLLRDIK